MAAILIADDESPIVALLADILGEQGYTILTAFNGTDALAIARAEHPDLILSDIMMPLLDGVQLTRLLREEPFTRDIIVILMSAARPPNLTAIGVVAFLAKPFEIEEVNRVVAKYLAAAQEQTRM